MISVIIPVYNTEKYIDECITSIVKQTYKDFEIIIVNDGSTDNSLQICYDWAKKDSRITVINQSNQGVSATRNTGIANARGEYLYFVDSDDYIESNLFADVMSVFENTNADIVSFGAQKIYNDGRVEICDKIYDGTMTSVQAVEKLMSGDMKDYLWARVYKKETFKDITFPVGQNFEDTATTYKVFLNAKSISFIPKVYYNYRVRLNSIISEMSNNTLRDIFVVRKGRYDDLMNIYPQVADKGFVFVAIAAIRFYDRSLWSDVDSTTLSAALEFLAHNKEKVLKSTRDIWIKLYYTSKPLYKFIRLIKHKIGNIVKRFR